MSAHKEQYPVSAKKKTRLTFMSQHWKDFFSDLSHRVKQPFGQPSFIFYFISIILIVGGLGVLISLSKFLKEPITDDDKLSIARSLSTYLLPVLATAFVELNLRESVKRSIRMFALFILVIGTVLAVFSLITSLPNWAKYSSYTGSFLALFLWWVAYSTNELFYEPLPAPGAAIGDNIPEPVGDLDEIQH
ncbi:MAG: hypothetical protein HY231_00130 [Acidobacteria bacterium]|nr:hypothetical protein [Acidobacteriota bacterium]